MKSKSVFCDPTSVTQALYELSDTSLYHKQYLRTRAFLEEHLATGSIKESKIPPPEELEKLDRRVLNKRLIALLESPFWTLDDDAEIEEFVHATREHVHLILLSLLYGALSKQELRKHRKRLTFIRQRVVEEHLLVCDGISQEERLLGIRERAQNSVERFLANDAPQGAEAEMYRALGEFVSSADVLPAEFAGAKIQQKLRAQLVQSAMKETSGLLPLVHVGFSLRTRENVGLPSENRLLCPAVRKALSLGVSATEFLCASAEEIRREQIRAFRMLGGISLLQLRERSEERPGLYRFKHRIDLEEECPADVQLGNLADNVFNALLLGVTPEQLGIGDRERFLLLIARQ